MEHILCERNVPSYEGVKRPYNQGTQEVRGDKQFNKNLQSVEFGSLWERLLIHPREAVRGGGTKKDFEGSIGVSRGRLLQAGGKAQARS